MTSDRNNSRDSPLRDFIRLPNGQHVGFIPTSERNIYNVLHTTPQEESNGSSRYARGEIAPTTLRQRMIEISSASSDSSSSCSARSSATSTTMSTTSDSDSEWSTSTQSSRLNRNNNDPNSLFSPNRLRPQFNGSRFTCFLHNRRPSNARISYPHSMSSSESEGEKNHNK